VYENTSRVYGFSRNGCTKTASAITREARQGPVAPALRSPKALKKIARKRTEDGWPAHSFETLLQDLGTICVNTIEPTDRSVPPFKKVTLPTPLQRRAFELLGVPYRLGYAA
jgi:hypothetical protein